jgi:hypothetical protein
MDKFSYEDFVRVKTIKKLPEIEKESYLSFHEKIWKEDFETGKSLIKMSPRWSVIAGYYAMHNLSKFFLAKKFNIKISGKFVHAATIEALRKFLKKKGIIQKIERATKFIPIEELPDLLEVGKKERTRSQYYAGRLIEITSKGAEEFFKNIVEPFVKAIEELL